jgi:hypothetical protein
MIEIQYNQMTGKGLATDALMEWLALKSGVESSPISREQLKASASATHQAKTMSNEN